VRRDGRGHPCGHFSAPWFFFFPLCSLCPLWFFYFIRVCAGMGGGIRVGTFVPPWLIFSSSVVSLIFLMRLPWFFQPIVFTITALIVCILFSVWSKTTLLGDSKTSSATSCSSGCIWAASVSRLCSEGRQCR